MMKNIKRLFKYLLYTVLGIVVFVLVYLGLAFVLSRITIDKEDNTSRDVALYILTNGVHTDIVVPVRNEDIDWSKEVKFSNIVSKDSCANYLAMGWGDKGFYLETPSWAELKASVAFKAAFALSTTAIHATYYDKMRVGESCRRIDISREQYRRLINYIKTSFQTDRKGHFMHIPTTANYGDSDAFYEANGRYSMLHTCNTWANNALKSCGQKACLWTPFDTGIFLKY